MAKKHLEYDIQKAICEYLDTKYPDVLYMSDTIANVRLTIPQANRNKSIQKDYFKCPDLLIFCAKGKFHGLFIELKIKSPFKKDGSLYKSEHLEGQAKTIDDLMSAGYYAQFSVGYEETKEIIDWYMNL
jgi:hypothetical protein